MDYVYADDTKHEKRNNDANRFNFDQPEVVKSKFVCGGKKNSNSADASSIEAKRNVQVLERWSPTKRNNVEVVDIHPSVPLDIALLHIETDALLESLRQSAITPKTIDQYDELSPTATNSTSGSSFTGTSSSTPRDESIVSIRNSSQLEEDAISVVSAESDDGMSGEIQNLNKLTTDMQQSFADFINTEGELEYEEFFQHSEHDEFLLFVRDLLMVCEDVSHAIIHSQSVKKLLHSKGGIYLLQSLRTRARYTIAFLYILLSFASICIKTGINRLVSS